MPEPDQVDRLNGEGPRRRRKRTRTAPLWNAPSAARAEVGERAAYACSCRSARTRRATTITAAVSSALVAEVIDVERWQGPYGDPLAEPCRVSGLLDVAGLTSLRRLPLGAVFYVIGWFRATRGLSLSAAWWPNCPSPKRLQCATGFELCRSWNLHLGSCQSDRCCWKGPDATVTSTAR